MTRAYYSFLTDKLLSRMGKLCYSVLDETRCLLLVGCAVVWQGGRAKLAGQGGWRGRGVGGRGTCLLHPFPVKVDAMTPACWEVRSTSATPFGTGTSGRVWGWAGTP